jgi:hypothetical protein
MLYYLNRLDECCQSAQQQKVFNKDSDIQGLVSVAMDRQPPELQILPCHANGASLRVICMKNQMKTWAKNVIILHAKYNPNIPWISYADPS